MRLNDGFGINGNFLNYYKISDQFLKNDQESYSLKLFENKVGQLTLLINNQELITSEKFEEGFIGIEINHYVNAYPPHIILKNGQEIKADFMHRNFGAEFPERGPANFLNGYHLISSKGTT